MTEEPLLPERIDLAGGVVASALANVNRSKGRPAFAPADFMPVSANLKRIEEEQISDEEFARRQMLKFQASFGRVA